MKTAFIFPAFVPEYLGNEPQLLHAYSGTFEALLDTAARAVDPGLADFSINTNNFAEEELRSQLISYVFSCSMVEVLREQKVQPDFLSGYSMGLYAALYCGNAITFEEGLWLIKEAYTLMQSCLADKPAGMGSIIGLTKKEIEALINQHAQVEIVNINGTHSHLISGLSRDIETILDLARKEGAISTTMLRVHTPYHSKWVAGAAMPLRDFIKNKIHIKPSDYVLFSCINGRRLQQSDEIIDEIIRNTHQHIDWQHCFQQMLACNISRFVECGAGKSLYNIGRFFDGTFTIFPMNKLNKLLQSK